MFMTGHPDGTGCCCTWLVCTTVLPGFILFVMATAGQSACRAIAAFGCCQMGSGHRTVDWPGLARNITPAFTTRMRRGDMDCRGNLTDAGLAEWVRYFLDVCEDQVTFMTRMLALDEMKKRIEALVLVRQTQDKTMRPQALLPLYHTFAAGPLTRREFVQMTGLGERTARTLMSYLLTSGLLVSDTALSPVRFGLPMDSLQYLLPQLYPEVNFLE